MTNSTDVHAERTVADASGARQRWTRSGLTLVVATLLHNVVEAVIAIWFGAEADSIALFGFGLDNTIECAAAAVLLWRLAVEAGGADAEAIEVAEGRVHRFIGFRCSLWIPPATLVTLTLAPSSQRRSHSRGRPK